MTAAAAASSAPNADTTRRALDLTVARTLPPLTLGLAALFAFFAVTDWYTRPAVEGHAVAYLDAAVAVVMMALHVTLRRRRVTPAAAHPVMLGVGLTIVVFGVAVMTVAPDPIESLAFIMLALGAGVVFLSVPYLATLLAVSGAMWALAAARAPDSPDWTQFGQIVLTASVLSLIVHQVRLRALERIERLRQIDRARQAELETANQRLRRASTQLEQAQAAAMIGSWEWDLARGTIAWSDETYRIFGYGAERPAMGPDTVFDRIHPDDVAPMRARLRRRTEAFMPPETRGPPVEFRVVLPTGELRWMSGRSVFMGSTPGRPDRIVGVVQDVTDHKDAARALAMHASALERSNKELAQFAYVVSHDLQEPLRAVAACVELLQDRLAPGLDEESRRLATFAIDETGHMKDLVRELLTYARVDAYDAVDSRGEAGNALAKALQNLSLAVADSHAQITRGPLPAVAMDETLLTQVFQNLIGNAIKFRKPEQDPSVHVGATRDGSWWRFDVRDDGIGIDPRHHDKLFRVFGRLHTREEIPGTGIGLALCKKIVERHGGRIWLTSEPGRGTTVSFTAAVGIVEKTPGQAQEEVAA